MFPFTFNPRRKVNEFLKILKYIFMQSSTHVDKTVGTFQLMKENLTMVTESDESDKSNEQTFYEM